MIKTVTKQALQRLPLYLHYLRSLPCEGTISATALANALSLGEVQVRKDLAAVSGSGKPKLGYYVASLIGDIERFLGYDNAVDAVIVGAGHLGCALLAYEGFKNYGLNIVAAFDTNEKIINTTFCEKRILPLDKLDGLCSRLNIHIGIITVPASQAQKVCDLLIKNGIKAVWNFAPTKLNAPEEILIQNENMASNLALLSNHVLEKLEQSKT